MKALLDTNIVIHREAPKGIHPDIGTLFKWLDKAQYTKCLHPITVSELQKFNTSGRKEALAAKLQSYYILKTTAPIDCCVQAVSDEVDRDCNDKNDTFLLNEVVQKRVNIFISEDKKIHAKAKQLGVEDHVYNIDGFLEKVVSENPDLINYDVLSVTKNYFGYIDLQDPFFDSFRDDYPGFDQWFNKKADEIAYVTHKDNRILSFLYLKQEDRTEDYSDITPIFKPKKRLKIGTFKVVSNGLRLGERFLKIVFDNAILLKVDEIYVTIFDRTNEQKRLIDLLLEWGFKRHGTKKTGNSEEIVLVRNLEPCFSAKDPKKTFPYISANRSIFLCPIYPQYHTELFPDSILKTESPLNFKESQPHRNALRKVYISRSIERNLASGDIIVFYRAASGAQNINTNVRARHQSVVTTIGIVESVINNIQNENEFVAKCRKRSVFTDEELKEHWNYNPRYRPFIVNFIYAYSFPKRPNMQKLIELGVIADTKSAPRGFVHISKNDFYKIFRESQSNESIIVN